VVVCPTTAVATSNMSAQHTAARRIAALLLTNNMAFLLVGGSPRDGTIVRPTLSEDA
jgi:hypothetical protein